MSPAGLDVWVLDVPSDFYMNGCWQAQRVRPKAKHRGAVGNWCTGVLVGCPHPQWCGQIGYPRRARHAQLLGM